MLMICVLSASIQYHVICVLDVFTCIFFARYSPINKFPLSLQGFKKTRSLCGVFFPLKVHRPARIYSTASLGENRGPLFNSLKTKKITVV